MRHVHPRLRAVPVALPGGDVCDVTRPHRALLVLGGDDPLARGHDEDLIGRMGMQLVPRPVAEGVLVQPEVAGLLADDRLGVHVSDEDVTRVPLPLLGRRPFDPHARSLTNAAALATPRWPAADRPRTSCWSG